MKKIDLAKLIVCFLVFLLLFSDVSAQCAMCKAVVESNQKNGGGIGGGLNKGILYLMAVPYVFMLVGGAFWYKTNKLKSEKE